MRLRCHRFDRAWRARRLCLTISDHVAVDLKHANARNHSTSGTSRRARRVERQLVAAARRRRRVSAASRSRDPRWRGTSRGRPADHPTVQISQSMTAVTLLTDRQQVAEPEVAVHDAGPMADGSLGAARRPRRPSPEPGPGRPSRSSRHQRSTSAAASTTGSSASPIAPGRGGAVSAIVRAASR